MSPPTWTASDAPDPCAILESACDDARSGNFENALEKFLWFHQNALRYDPDLSAVRVSFAMGYWMELAQRYPRALDTMCRIRDETEETFRRDNSDYRSFSDLAALNRELKEPTRTVELFLGAGASNPAVAKGLYHVAQPYLIAAGRLHDCAPFLTPTSTLKNAITLYQSSMRADERRSTSEYPTPRFAERRFIEKIGTLVALLAVNGREEDACAVIDGALAVLNEEEFRRILDSAWAGHFPATCS